MIIPVILVLVLPLIYAEEQVKLAVVIFRHGDRTPVQPYPTDPWRNESLWPVKFGQLTNLGKRQHYALGQWIRERYQNMLSEQFDPEEIYIRSTDVDRTLMSAQANMAGLYPPTGTSVWDPALPWQPIPIHTVPEKSDEVLAMKKCCPAYTKELERYTNTKQYKERLSKYQSLMDYLTAYTGAKVKDYMDIEYVYNTLYIETLYNFTLPNWTRNYYPDQMMEPSGYSFSVATATPLLARLRVGPLLKEITDKMREAASTAKSRSKLKMLVFSGHDITVADLLNSLGAFDYRAPPYTATVLMDLLHDNATNTHTIRISYRNSTEIVEPQVLKIPYCGTHCPLERFMKLYKNLITVDWEYECENQFTDYLSVAFLAGVGIIVLLYVAHNVYFAKIASRYRPSFKYTDVAEQFPQRLVQVIEAERLKPSLKQ